MNIISSFFRFFVAYLLLFGLTIALGQWMVDLLLNFHSWWHYLISVMLIPIVIGVFLSPLISIYVIFAMTPQNYARVFGTLLFAINAYFIITEFDLSALGNKIKWYTFIIYSLSAIETIVFVFLKVSKENNYSI